jgi:hypothetical protein
MMIGYDKIYTDAFSVFHFFIGNAAAVHGQDQIRALLLDQLNGFLVQAIAFIKTGRDVIGQVVRKMRQDLKEKADGRHSVCVIIAIDADPSVVFDGRQ